MKKTLVAALTTAMVVGAASTTFAAANPFSDVPSDHWAYDAVSQLAADGVIDGYGDSTFQGNKNITRYEMAQMIARAMAKKDVAPASDKALIDKLSAEFSDELNNLGVRVANLEKNADKVKWNGELRYTYQSTRHDYDAINNKKDTKNNRDELLLRLEPTAEVNSNWHVKARLDGSTDMDMDTNGEMKLQRLWAQGDYENFRVQLGKFPNGTDYDYNMLLNDQMSGAKVDFGKQVKVGLLAGRVNLNGDSAFDGSFKGGSIAEDDDRTANLQGITLGSTFGKVSGTLAYYHADTNAFKADAANHAVKYSNDGKEDNYDVWEIAGKYAFDKNVSLGGAYAQNESADAYDKSGIVQLNYKGAQKPNAGTWGAWAAYKHLGNNVSLDPNTDGVGYGQKGYEIGANYTLFSNVMLKGIYFNGKDLVSDKDAEHLFGRVEFFF